MLRQQLQVAAITAYQPAAETVTLNAQVLVPAVSAITSAAEVSSTQVPTFAAAVHLLMNIECLI
jgi:hypothetical protein